MEIRNGFSFRTAIRAWGYFVALGCLSLSAHAQSDWGDKLWWTASGSQWVPDYNKSAAFQGTKATPYTGGGALVVNGAGIVHGPAEWPKGRASAGIPGLAKSAPIDVVARFKPASVAAAAGRLAAKVGPLGSALALVTFAAEVGFILTDSNGDGVLEVAKNGPTTCTVAPCYTYRGSMHSQLSWQRSPETACRQWASVNGNAFISVGGTKTAATCTTKFGTNSPSTFTLMYQAATVEVPEPVPSNMTELESAIASQSGWPSGSSVAPFVKHALQAGEKIETEPATVSGPASSPVSVSVVNNPNGSTTTKTTTNNYTYNGPSVKVSTVTVTNTFNPATGTTDTTTETTEETPQPQPEEEQKNQCDLTPDALGCAELDTPTEEIPRETETIDFQEEEVFGSGSCPANLTASIATLGQSVTVWDWSKTCDLALPLRALVLGLASFAALLIVMPGDNKT